jgi:hypothetical protein
MEILIASIETNVVYINQTWRFPLRNSNPCPDVYLITLKISIGHSTITLNGGTQIFWFNGGTEWLDFGILAEIYQNRWNPVVLARIFWPDPAGQIPAIWPECNQFGHRNLG